MMLIVAILSGFIMGLYLGSFYVARRAITRETRLKNKLRDVLGLKASFRFPGNRARANEWQSSDRIYELQRHFFCVECGGWYLHRRDETGHIEMHSRGCSIGKLLIERKWEQAFSRRLELEKFVPEEVL